MRRRKTSPTKVHKIEFDEYKKKRKKKQNDKKQRCNPRTVASLVDDIDLPLLFNGYNQAHLCTTKKKEYKTKYYDCSTTHDRSLCV
jgi:trehalose/maltose hydrolase-like predicted phosphorylase